MTSRCLPERLRSRIRGADRVVVFTGAGISQESGLGTFRGPGGLWERARPEDLATPEAFARDAAGVTRWYLHRFAAMRAALPNPGHLAIARWEKLFPSLVVVTQNIDRLHQRAGSRDVLELHGTIWVWRCTACRREEAAENLDATARGAIACRCGGAMRPGVVWFGEPLPGAVFERAAEEARRSDLFLVVGTSGTVWPAAGLVEIAASYRATVIEVNPEGSGAGEAAEAVIRGKAGEVLPAIELEMGRWRSST